MTVVEVVCCSVEDCVLAQEAGADRIELCVAIELGGLTPSLGLLERSKTAVDLPILAMVRPRPGGFLYSAHELSTAIDDAHLLIKHGADGLVFGGLTESGEVDMAACAEIVRAAGGKRTTFHRAFDRLANPLEALRQLEELGYTSVMTSGGYETGLEGADRLGRYRESSKLEIVAAGGVRPDNVRQIVEKSGCTQVHLGPFRCLEESGYDGFGASILDFDVLQATVRSLKS